MRMAVMGSKVLVFVVHSSMLPPRTSELVRRENFPPSINGACRGRRISSSVLLEVTNHICLVKDDLRRHHKACRERGITTDGCSPKEGNLNCHVSHTVPRLPGSGSSRGNEGRDLP